MKVLFIHRIVDWQFIKLHNYYNSNNIMESYILCWSSQAVFLQGTTKNMFVFDDSTVDSDSNSKYYYSWTYESGSRLSESISRSMKNLLAHTSFDVIVYHCTMWSIHLSLDINIPIIHYLEFISYEHFWWKEEYSPMIEQRQADKWMEALSYLNIINSDLTIVPSNYTYNTIPDILKSKIQVQYDGFVLPNKFPKKIKKNKFKVGFFARNLDSSKGFDQFCKILHELLQRPWFDEYEFIIVWDESAWYCYDSLFFKEKSMKETLLNQYDLNDRENITIYSKLPYLEYLEQINDVDVVIYPIYSGSLCWWLLEVMSCGKAVISSDRAFAPEIIDDWVNGFVCDYDDIDMYCEKIEYLKLNSKVLTKMWKNSLETVKKKFSIDIVAKQYMLLFEKVIS